MWAEAWLWLRGSGGVEAVRIGVADPLLLPKRVEPVGFLLERAEAWAMGRVARAGLTLDIGSRRAVPDEEGAHGLVSTLLGLAVDAPQLIRCIETDTLWVDLEEAAEEAAGLAELFVIRES